MTASVGQIDLDLGINYGGFNKELNGIASKASGMVGGAFTKLGGIIAGAFATAKLIDFGKGAIELASNLQEVQNVVDVTFGSMSAEVNSWSQNMIDSFGLSELSAKKYSSTMGAMLKSSGLAGVQMKDMSKQLTELAADMSSFYNLSNDEAFYKIFAGMTGETEPLKSLGVNLSVANMEAFALSKGIQKSYEKMTQAEQTLLRYNYLLSVTKDAQGDFARTSDSWANQTRVLSEQWKIFKGTIGAGLINALTPTIGWVNTLIAKLQVAAQYFKAFTALLFGNANAVEASTAKAAASTASMGVATEDAGKAAQKAAKATKGSLSSFDQLNVLSQSTAAAMDDVASSALAAGGVDLGQAQSGTVDIGLNVDTAKLQGLLDIFHQVGSATKQLGITMAETFGPSLGIAIESIRTPVELLWMELQKVFGKVAELGTPFKAWFTNDLTPFLQKTIVNYGVIISGLLDSFALVFGGISDVSMPVLSWFVNDGLPLLTTFASQAEDIIMVLFRNTKKTFDNLWREGVQPGIDLTSDMMVDSLNIIKGFWDKWGDGLVESVSGYIDGIFGVFNTWWESFFGPFWENMLKGISWLWEEHLSGLVEEALEFVGTLTQGALDIYNKFVLPINRFLIELLGPTFSNIMSLIGDVILTLLGVVIDVAKGILRALGGVIDFVVGIFTGDWERAWRGIGDIFAGVWDAMVGVLKGTLNLFIDMINFFVRSWNGMKLEVPSIDLGPLGKFGGFTLGLPNIKEITKLAKGGLAYGPTLAMVGDNKGAASDPEVISPLSKLNEMLTARDQPILEALMMIVEILQGFDPTMEMDGEVLGRWMRNKLRAEDSRIGRSAVTIGGVSIR